MNDNFNTDPNVIPFPEKKLTYPNPSAPKLMPLQDLLNMMNSNIADLEQVCLFQQSQLDYLKKENEWMLIFLAIIGGLLISKILVGG